MEDLTLVTSKSMNSYLKRREERMKNRPMKVTGTIKLREWQERQRVNAELREAQDVYDKVERDKRRYAETKEKAEIQDQERETIASNRLQSSGLEDS